MAEVKKPTQEDIEAGLRMLARAKEQRAKQRDRLKNDPQAKAKAQARSLKLRIKGQLLVKKALAAGITVSDKEIDAEIAKAKKT